MVGAQLWRTNDGTSWAQAITPSFGDPNNQKVDMVYVFQNQLYVSVKNTLTGIEIWRSTDGTLWEQANQDGFGDSHNASSNWSNASTDFLGQLYVGTANTIDGGELWRMDQHGANLALSKVDALDPVTLGDPIHYTLSVSNAGPETALNVILTDDLPVGVSYVSATPNQGSCGEGSGVVTCNLGDLPIGGSLNVDVLVTSLTVGVKSNQASVTADTADPNLVNNGANENTSVGLNTHLPLILR